MSRSPAAEFARKLDFLIALRAKPKSIVSDNGPELTSNAILSWTAEAGVDWHYVNLGKPVQNPFIETPMAACATSS